MERDISQVTADEINALFGNSELKILAGCAPCQPFSTYAQRYESVGIDGKWGLLYQFGRLVRESHPDVITMENVPTVVRHQVFYDFVAELKDLGYHFWYDVIDSSLYGVPQSRRRMVLLASKFGEIRMIEPTHPKPKTVEQVIGGLPPIGAGQSHRLHEEIDLCGRLRSNITEQALLQVIESARKSLFITSFVAYDVSSIIDALNAAITRGVKVSMLLESSDDHGGSVTIDVIGKMRELIPEATIYGWVRKSNVFSGDRVHAKIALADANSCFITSANLTGFAMEKNMEAGVLVNGGRLPTVLSSHLTKLIELKIIELV